MDKSQNRTQKKPIIKVHHPQRSVTFGPIDDIVTMGSAADIHTSFQTFVNLWVKFNGAGSLFLQELCTLLSTAAPCPFMPSSSVATVSLESHSALLQTVQEMDSLLLKYCNKRGSNSKILISCILLYVKLQRQYHIACQDALNNYIQQLAQKCREFNHTHISEQLVKHGLITAPPSVSSTTSASPVIAKPAAGQVTPVSTQSLCGHTSAPPNHSIASAPPNHSIASAPPPTELIGSTDNITSPRTNKNFRDSLFSLFNRKVPNDNRSSFYVQDVDRKPDATSLNALNQNVTTRSRKNEDVTSGGGLVSEADLDNVINLLCGVGADTEGCLQTPTPAPEPCFVLPDNYFSVPHVTVSGPPPLPPDDLSHSQPVGHRPYDFNRSSNPWSPPNIITDYGPSQLHTNLPSTMPAIMQTGPPGFEGSVPGYVPDVRLNQTWPISSGGLTVNSGWSVGHDSDDLSDDSSTGEPCQFTTRDHTTQPQDVESDDDADERFFSLPRSQRPRSMDNLMDSEQFASWSTEHERLAMNDADALMNHRDHPPLQMYYSDPMSASNIWAHPDSRSTQPERDKHT